MGFFTSVLTLAWWGLWGYTVLFIDPSSSYAPVAFYLTLFAALTCTFARLFAGSSDKGDSSPAFGHGAIVSVLLLFGLWLQSLRMLTAINSLLLIALFGLIEVSYRLAPGNRRHVRRRPRRTSASGASMPSDR